MFRIHLLRKSLATRFVMAARFKIIGHQMGPSSRSTKNATRGATLLASPITSSVTFCISYDMEIANITRQNKIDVVFRFEIKTGWFTNWLFHLNLACEQAPRLEKTAKELIAAGKMPKWELGGNDGACWHTIEVAIPPLWINLSLICQWVAISSTWMHWNVNRSHVKMTARAKYAPFSFLRRFEMERADLHCRFCEKEFNLKFQKGHWKKNVRGLYRLLRSWHLYFRRSVIFGLPALCCFFIRVCFVWTFYNLKIEP